MKNFGFRMADFGRDVRNGQELSDVVKRWSNIVRNGQELSRMVKDGQGWSRVDRG